MYFGYTEENMQRVIKSCQDGDRVEKGGVGEEEKEVVGGKGVLAWLT